MNTPAHLVVSAVLLGRGSGPSLWFPISFGAVLPDLPMFVFYFYERLWAGRSEMLIWTERYYDASWQGFFDTFNSLPLIAGALVIAHWRGSKGFVALLLSMALHVAGDFFVHREDGHRHFFPFTDWHFISPVSYWDPAHHGLIFGSFEALGVVLGSVVLIRRREVWRRIGVACLAIYLVYGAFAIFAFPSFTET